MEPIKETQDSKEDIIKQLLAEKFGGTGATNGTDTNEGVICGPVSLCVPTDCCDCGCYCCYSYNVCQ